MFLDADTDCHNYYNMTHTIVDHDKSSAIITDVMIADFNVHHIAFINTNAIYFYTGNLKAVNNYVNPSVIIQSFMKKDGTRVAFIDESSILTELKLVVGSGWILYRSILLDKNVVFSKIEYSKNNIILLLEHGSVQFISIDDEIETLVYHSASSLSCYEEYTVIGFSSLNTIHILKNVNIHSKIMLHSKNTLNGFGTNVHIHSHGRCIFVSYTLNNSGQTPIEIYSLKGEHLQTSYIETRILMSPKSILPPLLFETCSHMGIYYVCIKFVDITLFTIHNNQLVYPYIIYENEGVLGKSFAIRNNTHIMSVLFTHSVGKSVELIEHKWQR